MPTQATYRGRRRVRVRVCPNTNRHSIAAAQSVVWVGLSVLTLHSGLPARSCALQDYTSTPHHRAGRAQPLPPLRIRGARAAAAALYLFAVLWALRARATLGTAVDGGGGVVAGPLDYGIVAVGVCCRSSTAVSMMTCAF